MTSQENQDWCRELYEARADALILYGRALGLSHAEAEDVLQETFLGLLRLEEMPEQPEHYSVRAFRNRALNYRRSLWRRLAREFEAGRWFEKPEDRSLEEREAMRQLQSLPPEQREVIVLKLWHGYTFQVIAGLLEISPNTVAGRYRYGLEKLRRSLKGKVYDESIREADAGLETATGVVADQVDPLSKVRPARDPDRLERTMELAGAGDRLFRRCPGPV